jgi:hypothetical protein
VTQPQPKRELGLAIAVALAVTVLGAGLGLLWFVIAPPLPVRKVEGGYAYIQPDPEQPVAADGWFVILGLFFGILIAIAVWAILRRYRGPLQMLALVLGTLAAGFIALKTGQTLEERRYEPGVRNATAEQVVDSPAKPAVTRTQLCVPLTGRCTSFPGGIQLIPALGASLAYAVMAGWSRWPGLRPGEEDDGDLSSPTVWDPADPESPGPPVPDATERPPGREA